jgi:hypothetical protein
MFGRYLVKSFTNLNQILVTPIKRFFIPKQYTFIDLPVQNDLSFRSVPFEDWKHVK